MKARTAKDEQQAWGDHEKFAETDPEFLYSLIADAKRQIYEEGKRTLERRQWWLDHCSRHRPTVRDRLLAMNPYHGPNDGCIPYGWHPKQSQRVFCMLRCLMTAADFDRKHGRGAHKTLPPGSIWKDGRRKYVTHMAARAYRVERNT